MPGYGTHVTTLAHVRHEAGGCRRCGVWRDATQVVFGEGPATARILMVGEQPGDVEDRRGRPFVGPAGALLRELLEEVGLPEEDVYLTNAVKAVVFPPASTWVRADHPEKPGTEGGTRCRHGE